MLFVDRKDAGDRLANRLREYAGRDDVVVLGLPRGGVPVAYRVAKALRAPLDVFLVRRLPMPGEPRLALGAVASHGLGALNDEVVHGLHVPDQSIREVASVEREALERRERAYRGGRPPAELEGRIVILVDEGIAPGSAMRAAILALRGHGPAKIVAAAPVGEAESCVHVEARADDLVCARMPTPFVSVGVWYGDFRQPTDEEIRGILARAARYAYRPLPALAEI
jgi:predicted phosphoribosyltransferase